MTCWPFVTCHSCLKPVKAPERAVHDVNGFPHHQPCLQRRVARGFGPKALFAKSAGGAAFPQETREPFPLPVVASRGAGSEVRAAGGGAGDCVREGVSSLNSPGASAPGAFSGKAP